MSDRTQSRREGKRRKDAAHMLLEARRECYLREGRRVLLSRLLERGTATIDDVRDAVELPDGVDPVCVGAVPGLLARAGIIRRGGFATTTRPVAHARPVSVWQLADASKAEQWLATHQPLPPPASQIPLKRETPPAVTGGASVQSTLPGFNQKGIE